MLVRAVQAAKVRALSRADAGDEEAHVGLLRRRGAGKAKRQDRDRRGKRQAFSDVHGIPSSYDLW
jgi:hypothetical protein